MSTCSMLIFLKTPRDEPAGMACDLLWRFCKTRKTTHSTMDITHHTKPLSDDSTTRRLDSTLPLLVPRPLALPPHFLMLAHQEEEDASPPFSSLFGENGDDGDESDGGGPIPAEPPMATPQIDTIDETDLRAVTGRIGEALPIVCSRYRGGDGYATDILAVVAELQYRTQLIGRHMGSLALCRGSRGDALHEAGAVDATLRVLANLNRHEMLLRPEALTNSTCGVATQTQNEMARLPPTHGNGIICNSANDENLSSSPQIDDATGWTPLDQAAIALASACLGSIRDLACGNASNRAAISEFKTESEIPPFCCTSDDSTTVTGPQILASYIKRYHLLHWEDILRLGSDNDCNERGKKELRLLTDATGAIRNSSHSTPKTCAGLHSALVTEMFIWRLKEGSKQSGPESVPATLPDSSIPWWEASFRIAGSLINISERCSACAEFLWRRSWFDPPVSRGLGRRRRQ